MSKYESPANHRIVQYKHSSGKILPPLRLAFVSSTTKSASSSPSSLLKAWLGITRVITLLLSNYCSLLLDPVILNYCSNFGVTACALYARICITPNFSPFNLYQSLLTTVYVIVLWNINLQSQSITIMNVKA